MGLMDKIKEEFEQTYISIEDFILYLAFRLEEPVETVVSWLLYNGFDKNISSYEVDKHYRIYCGDKTNGSDDNISQYFEQISIDGYFGYQEYLNDDEYHYDGDEDPSYDVYSLINRDFYLKLDDINRLKYITSLNPNLNFLDARKYRYDVHLCDSISARLDTNSYPGIKFYPALIYSKLDRGKIKETPLNNNQPFEAINFKALSKVIEWVASGKELPNQDQGKGANDEDNESEASVSIRSQDKKLIAVLALLLASKSNTYQVGNKRPNATQISKAIYEFAVDDLKIAEEDMTGLKANINKISKAIQEYTDILYKRPE